MAEAIISDTETVSNNPPVPVHTININQNQGAGSSFPLTGLGVVLPPAVAAQMGSGGFTVVLEPVQPTSEGGAGTFSIKTVPVEATPTQSGNVDDSGSDGDSEGEEGNNSDSNKSAKTPAQQPVKKRGLGSSHKGGKNGKYSLWMRIGLTSDIRLC